MSFLLSSAKKYLPGNRARENRLLSEIKQKDNEIKRIEARIRDAEDRAEFLRQQIDSEKRERWTRLVASLPAGFEARVISEADRFADGLIFAQKIFPSQDDRGFREKANAETFEDLGPVGRSFYFFALADHFGLFDNTLQGGSSLAIFKASFERGAPHGLCDSFMSSEKSQSNSQAAIDEERIRKLHAHTPSGVEILRRQHKDWLS